MKGTILVLGLPVTTEGQQALKTLKEKHNETDFVGVVCDNTRNAFEELLKKTAVDYSNIIGIQAHNWRMVSMRPINAEILSCLPNLKIVTSGGAGYDYVDVDSLTPKGITYCNTPNAVTKPTATLATTLILACVRKIHEGDALIRSGTLQKLPPPLFTKEPQDLTVGILGAGRIGRYAARQLRAFDFKIVYHNRKRLSPELEEGAQYEATLEGMLKRSNVLLIAIPLSPTTQYIIGKKELDLMPPKSVIVNIARGGLVDENALADAIESGHIAGAGLDTLEGEALQTPQFNKRLLEQHKVILTPHIGALTSGSLAGCETELSTNIDEFLSHTACTNAVNDIQQR